MLQPRKTKEILEKVAKENNLDEELVNDIVSFYWTEVRKKMAELKGPRLYITGLGTFQVKYKKVCELIERYQCLLDTVTPDTMAKYASRKDNEKRLEKLRNIKQVMIDELEKKKQIKKSRYGKGTT